MTHQELDKQIERILRQNQAAIRRVRERSDSLIRNAERFDPAFDRAVERLRKYAR